jgi:TonB family protein
MPQSSNVLSFVPVPNVEHGQRRSSAPHPRPAGVEDEVVLRKIAEAALSATGADGAALALRRDGEVVCVARAGEMAPPLDARLDDSSGISGECLRQGQALRCEDTETDDRVDAEACRSLGLRSLAVAAVQQGDQVVGILEVFSQHPSTFTERHLEVLRQLSELVIAEAEIESAEVESPPVAKSPPEVPSAATVPQPRLLPAKAPEDSPVEAPVAVATAAPAQALEPEKLPLTALTATLPADVNISAYMAAHEKAQSQGPIRVPKIVLVGLATIVLASFVGWYLGHRTPSGPVATAAATPAAPLANAAASTATPLPAVSEVKPSPGVSSTTNGNQDRSKPASDSLTNAATKNRVADNSVNVTKPISVVPNPPAAAAESDAAPALPVANGDAKSSDTVTALLDTPAALPVRAPPISQGVEGGEVERQVAAIYPPQARAVGQHGTVVLEVLVATNGTVKDLKVVSGPPMLRQAAMDAVRRWKYQPFKLNGKAIAAQTQVQVDFKLQ